MNAAQTPEREAAGPSAETTDVLLAEGQSIVRAGVRRLVEGFGGFRVVAETDDGLEALRLLRERRPRIAVIELNLRSLNGLGLIARIVRSAPQTRCVVLSGEASADRVREALHAGAQSYVLKTSIPEDLENALRATSEGRPWLSPALLTLLADARAASVSGALPRTVPGYDSLTPRQREILQLIAEGRATRDIAAKLALSAKTVEAHRARIMHRLRIFDVAGLTRFAIRVGLVSAEN